MGIKSLVPAIAIALAASFGSASAAEMSTLKGISAEPMKAAEMAAVRGGFDNGPPPPTPLAVLTALGKQAGVPPGGPGNSIPNFNGSVAGPIWIGRAACVSGSVSCGVTP